MSKRKPARARKVRSASRVRSEALQGRKVFAARHQPRAHSKQMRVLGLLSQPSGATVSTSGRWFTEAMFTAVSTNPLSIVRCLRRCRTSLPPRRWRGAVGYGAHPREPDPHQ
jgi:hypothetical protein